MRNALGLGLRLYVLVKRLKPSEMYRDVFRIKKKKKNTILALLRFAANASVGKLFGNSETTDVSIMYFSRCSSIKI